MRHQCLEACYLYNEVVNFAAFDGCFPKQWGPKFGFSDLDAIAERHGHYFVIEWKKGQGNLPTGQAILAEALSRLPEFTVFAVWGHPGEAAVTHIQRYRDGDPGERRTATLQDLRAEVTAWAKWVAENHG